MIVRDPWRWHWRGSGARPRVLRAFDRSWAPRLRWDRAEVLTARAKIPSRDNALAERRVHPDAVLGSRGGRRALRRLASGQVAGRNGLPDYSERVMGETGGEYRGSRCEPGRRAYDLPTIIRDASVHSGKSRSIGGRYKESRDTNGSRVRPHQQRRPRRLGWPRTPDFQSAGRVFCFGHFPRSCPTNCLRSARAVRPRSPHPLTRSRRSEHRERVVQDQPEVVGRNGTSSMVSRRKAVNEECIDPSAPRRARLGQVTTSAVWNRG
jgi:hypothetical protein